MLLKYITYVLFLLILAQGCADSEHIWTVDDVTVYETFEELEPLLHLDNDTTYLINFWATWCSPCVKELPYFEGMHEHYKGKPFKVVLVSLDFKKQLEKKVIPFLNEKKIKSDVVLLADGKANKWIDRVDPEWSGAIPITLVVSGKESTFYETEFHSEEELIEIISPYLK